MGAGAPPEKKAKKDKPVVTAPGAWISVGLIVQVNNPKIQGGKFYEAKGTVLKVEGDFVAYVRIQDSKEVLKIEQVGAARGVNCCGDLRLCTRVVSPPPSPRLLSLPWC